MAEISRVALFGKLAPLGYQTIEAATVFCKMRGNPYVELAHWFHQILQLSDSDLHRIIRHFELDEAKISRDITAALDSLPRGASSISDLSAHLEHAMERAWVYASLLFDAKRVRTGHMLLGLVKTPDLRNILRGISAEFSSIGADALADEFSGILEGSPEDDAEAETAAAPGEPAPAVMGKEEALSLYCTDLTEQARAGEIDRIVGRDTEIRMLVDVLVRRRQNNPILTGEAGVGKTAIVEGFALRIARGDVPPSLRDARLLALDIGLLQAGASMKGEFEKRLRSVIDEVQASPVPTIIFIDETHTLIGAGGASGTGDAANLLKPALARGTFRTIGATTWSEYKRHIEKDPALTRRFQVVAVDEPGIDSAVTMMRGTAGALEEHHRVQILDEALDASVRLSARYIPARQLPDKSVSVLDTASARVAISQYAVPPEVDNARQTIASFDTELEIIARDESAGIDVETRRAAAIEGRSQEEEKLHALEERWNEERELVDEILEIRAKLLEPGEDDAPEALRTELGAVSEKLSELQGETPLIMPIVDSQAVGAVVADWTGIPVGRMIRDEIRTVLDLADRLSERVIGQDHAMQMIARRIRTSRARLDNPSKPVGVFLLAGTSGIGKTETALALAEILYGGEQNLITINMSEFQEAHTVSSLKGSPPGYVGYGEGGVLTEAVRRRPYSVVLLDEVEKAHPDVHEIFFQVFDKGMMDDSEGRRIDFRNTLILLTSNVGSDRIMSLCADPDLMPDPEGLASALREPLLEVFPPALLGRLVTIPYYPLSPEMIGTITRLQLDRIMRRVEENHRIPMTYTDAVVETVVSRCQEVESGGRMIDAIVTNTILPEIAGEFLRRLMEGEEINAVHVDVKDGGFDFSY